MLSFSQNKRAIDKKIPRYQLVEQLTKLHKSKNSEFSSTSSSSGLKKDIYKQLNTSKLLYVH